ncbi:MAG: hypothetical protein WC538_22230 [Thermoanaerobaculia bacterium]|jgi:hypothetical protein
MNTITVTPAYGRDYKSAAAAKADWDANKDFAIASVWTGGTYINKEDAENHPSISAVSIRYRKLRRQVVVRVTRG